jgi:antitoxin component YwqK of YwqJK toxin-antitoxin module
MHKKYLWIILFICFCMKAFSLTLITGDQVEGTVMEKYASGKIKYFRLNDASAINIPEVGKVTVHGTISLYENGQLMVLHLEHPQEINTPMGIFEVYSELHFHNNGKLSACYFKQVKEVETSIGKILVSNLFFYESGKLLECWPWSNKKNNNILSTAIGVIKLYDMIYIRFYESGELLGFALHNEMSVTTSVGAFLSDFIIFYKNGKLMICSFDTPKKINTPNGEMTAISIGFHESGELFTVWPTEDTVIQGKNYKRIVLGWDENGNLLGEMVWNNELVTWVPKNK